MNLAIITNKPYSQCETFIKAQIDGLPFSVFHYYGQCLPFIPSAPLSFIKKVLIKIGIINKLLPAEILIKEFKQKKIEVVLAQYGMIGAEILPVCKQLNLPLVIHFHGHDAVRTSVLKRYKEAYKAMFLYPKATIVSVSHEMTKRLIALGCPKEKIKYNTYGPHPDFLKVTPSYKSNQFIGIGRFVDKKAPHLLILAFKKVVEHHPNVQLILAGDGALWGSCSDLVKALSLEQNVILPGRITPNAYREYLQESLAYVQHSLEAYDGDMEGTPVSILEASAAGLPVVSTYHAGIPDVILHNKTGLLSEERDIDAMSNHMLFLLKHPEQAKIMGDQGKQRIANEFSIEKHLKGLTAVIKTYLNE